MILTVTDKTIVWLTQRRIFSSCFYGHSRWKVNDLIGGGDAVLIEPYVGFYESNVLCEMGSFSYCSSRVGQDWKIGRYCSISWNVTSPSPNHRMDLVSTSNCAYDHGNGIIRAFIQDQKAGPIGSFENIQKPSPIIENDVWVGAGVVLMPGVKLGTGCVVAAHSVVTKDVKPYEIVGGNPAKHIRFRFPEEVRNELFSSNWWQYKFTDLMCLDFDKPEQFIKNFDVYKSDFVPWSPRKFRLDEIQS